MARLSLYCIVRQPMATRLCSDDTSVYFGLICFFSSIEQFQALSGCLILFLELSVLPMDKSYSSHAMKRSRVKNSLATLLGDEPAWANPEESVGEFIKIIDGKKRCWKAKGRAREVFEILAIDIKSYSDKCIDSIPGSDWVTWSIYMIGRTPQTAVPVIMFFCEERGPRKKVHNSVKQSEILKRYPGIKSGNAALPPDLEQLQRLASDAMSHGENFNISMFQNKVIVEFSRENAISIQVATAGGVVYFNGDACIFTAGHVFYGTSPSGTRKVSKTIDDKWEIDSDSHSESGSDTEVDLYDKDFVESTSRASNSHSDDSSSDTPSIRSSPFSDASTHVDEVQSPSMAPASRKTVKMPAYEDTTPETVIDITEPRPEVLPSLTITGGRVVALSPDFDYALIKFKDQNFNGNKVGMNLIRPTHVVTMASRDVKIVTSTVSGGLMSGTLSATPSYTRLPNSKTFQKVYTVRLKRALVKGDCGSWVIDAEDGGLYGHIIAGSASTQTAYIMSAHKIFEDSKASLGGELLLACGVDSMTLPSIDSLEATGSKLTRKPLSNQRFKKLKPHIRKSEWDSFCKHLDSISMDGATQVQLLKNDESSIPRHQVHPQSLKPSSSNSARHPSDDGTRRRISAQTISSFHEGSVPIPFRRFQPRHEKFNAISKREKTEKTSSDYDSLESETDDSVFSGAQTARTRSTEFSEYGGRGSQRQSRSSFSFWPLTVSRSGSVSWHLNYKSDDSYAIPARFHPDFFPNTHEHHSQTPHDQPSSTLNNLIPVSKEAKFELSERLETLMTKDPDLYFRQRICLTYLNDIEMLRRENALLRHAMRRWEDDQVRKRLLAIIKRRIDPLPVLRAVFPKHQPDSPDSNNKNPPIEVESERATSSVK